MVINVVSVRYNVGFLPEIMVTPPPCVHPGRLPAGADPNRGSEGGDGKESRRAVIITA